MPICAASGTKFEISDVERAFYRRHDVPEPDLSPAERLRRRLTFRHGGNLHHVNCALTGKSTVSMHPPTSPFPIYEQTAWWSDAWSGFDQARDVDLNRSFVTQLHELSLVTPHIALVTTNCENSYYNNHGLNLKNCYLLFGATDNEDCLYGYFVITCRDVLDSMSVVGCELCYDGVASFDCYDCVSFTNSKNCNHCVLVEDCNSCESCIGCIGLRGKKHHVFNQPVGKEEYEKLRGDLERSRYANFAQLEAQFATLKRNVPRLFAHLYQCEDCTGDMLHNSKECHGCFDLRKSEHCHHVALSPNSLHSQDCTFTAPDGVQFSYECVSTLASESKFNAIVWRGVEVDYSRECHNSKNLFGCFGLKKAQFCILNKQYTESQYFELREKIIATMKMSGEWGEFFPILHSPHAYNDSMAVHYFPLSKSEASLFGYRWRDEPEQTDYSRQSSGEMDAAVVDPADESACNSTFRCRETGKRYKITPAEFRFYQKMHLPLPIHAPDERHRRRFARRHRFQLFQRSCSSCGVPLRSIYTEHDAPNVLCEKDFLAMTE